jgi:hypothetical protein
MIGTLRKEIHGDELYLYNAKGELIFKRWLKHGYSKVFTPFPYGKNDTLVSITEEGIKYKDEQNKYNSSNIK